VLQVGQLRCQTDKIKVLVSNHRHKCSLVNLCLRAGDSGGGGGGGAGGKVEVKIHIENPRPRRPGKAYDSDVEEDDHQLRESAYKWLSPPDPSMNHNIACATSNKRPAAWFFQEGIFREWKRGGSLLWIHGKRALCLASSLTRSHAILYL